MVRPDTPRSARVIQVIETVTTRGNGVDHRDPLRVVTQYWSFEGALLAEHDPTGRASTGEAHDGR